MVQMMWADGRNQAKEKALVSELLHQHAAELKQLAGGQEVVPNADVQLFKANFLDCRPASELLEQLSTLALEILASKPTGSPGADGLTLENRRIFHLCLEIAAACYAGSFEDFENQTTQRMAAQEVRLVERLFSALYTQPIH